MKYPDPMYATSEIPCFARNDAIKWARIPESRRVHPLAFSVLLCFWFALRCAAQDPAHRLEISTSRGATSYTISLAAPEQHFLEVQIFLPPGSSQRELQLPVWNALYQVRNFAQHV